MKKKILVLILLVACSLCLFLIPSSKAEAVYVDGKDVLTVDDFTYNLDYETDIDSYINFNSSGDRVYNFDVEYLNIFANGSITIETDIHCHSSTFYLDTYVYVDATHYTDGIFFGEVEFNFDTLCLDDIGSDIFSWHVNTEFIHSLVFKENGLYLYVSSCCDEFYYDDFFLLASGDFADLEDTYIIEDASYPVYEHGAFLSYLASFYDSDNSDEIYQSGYDKGLEDGYLDGKDDGYSNGYDDGFDDGFIDGAQVGYNDGYLAGQEDNTSYDKGYADGLDLSRKNILGPLYNSTYQGFYNNDTNEMSSVDSTDLDFDLFVDGSTIKLSHFCSAIYPGNLTKENTTSFKIYFYLNNVSMSSFNFISSGIDCISFYNADGLIHTEYFRDAGRQVVNLSNYNDDVSLIILDIVDYSKSFYTDIGPYLVFNTDVPSFDRGYSNGLKDGKHSCSLTHKSLEEEYFNLGYTKGYGDGYGAEDFSFTNLLWTIAGLPFESFKTIWSVNFLGVNLADFLSGLILAIVGIYLIKKVIL